MDGHTDKSSHQAMEDKVMAELKKHFRPEFLNRVDDVIIFQSLDEANSPASWISNWPACKSASPNNNSPWTWTPAPRNSWPPKATTRNSAPARSNAPSGTFAGPAGDEVIGRRV